MIKKETIYEWDGDDKSSENFWHTLLPFDYNPYTNSLHRFTPLGCEVVTLLVNEGAEFNYAIIVMT